jgi:serine/threonine-protein kinase
MTTRDPRSRSPSSATPTGGVREATQSLDVEIDDAPSLASGTGLPAQTRNVAGPRARRSSRIDDSFEYLGAVLGSYRIAELLGKGGMGYVFRAEHVKLGREVALKLLRSDYASRRDAVARFFQEARTVNRVRHRNIVDVTDFVELDDGTTFIIMELLTGQSLGAWAKTGIDLPRALAVLVQICDGLGAAHQVGVVHRDLKPDNVIIVPTADGAELVKLLDFGVAKLVHREDVDIGFETQAGSVIGTPAYMSPEQAGGMTVDGRSDIYSLGAIMYELFCGQPMFRGRSFGEYVRKHLTEHPAPPRATPGGAGIDLELEAVILRCLDKDPDQRFADIHELRDALLARLGSFTTQPPALVARAQMPTLYAPTPAAPMGYGTQLALHGQAPGVSPSQLHSGSAPALPVAHGSARTDPSQVSSEIRGLSSASGVQDPSQLSGLSSAQHALARGGYASQVGYAPPRAAVPWWAWAAGGACAVAIGVGTAVWYAGRGPTAQPVVVTMPVTPPPPPPTAQPIEERPAPIELRFDALPSGTVFADGKPGELCRTPCTVRVDLGDGGPADRRTFLVKREGYRDGAVTVDLTAAKREFRVLLEQLPAEPVAAEPTPEPDAKTVEPEDPTPTRRPGKRAKPRPTRDHLLEPGSERAVPTKRSASPAIDPADTLDPFRKK